MLRRITNCSPDRLIEAAKAQRFMKLLVKELLLLLASDTTNMTLVDDHQVWHDLNGNVIFFQPHDDVSECRAVELIIAQLDVSQGFQRLLNAIRKHLETRSKYSIAIQVERLEIRQIYDGFECEVFKFVVRQVECDKADGKHSIFHNDCIVGQIQGLQVS